MCFGELPAADCAALAELDAEVRDLRRLTDIFRAGDQPDSVVVEHLVRIADRDHFTIASRLSTDRGRSWTALSRSEYERAR